MFVRHRKSLASRLFSKLTLGDEGVCFHHGLYLFDVTLFAMCGSITLVFPIFPPWLLMVNGQLGYGKTGLGFP